MSKEVLWIHREGDVQKCGYDRADTRAVERQARKTEPARHSSPAEDWTGDETESLLFCSIDQCKFERYEREFSVRGPRTAAGGKEAARWFLMATHETSTKSARFPGVRRHDREDGT